MPMAMGRCSLSSSLGRASEAGRVIRWKWGAGAGVGIGGLATFLLLSSPLALDDEAVSTTQPSGQGLISYQEVEKHNTRGSCWVVINSMVYDVTDFLSAHPGGASVILKNSGQDATSVYTPIHPPGTIENTLPPEAVVGPIDPLTVPERAKVVTEDERRVEEARRRMPPVAGMVSLDDFERVAKDVLSKTAWAYYSSAGDDEYAARENRAAFKRYWFRPRILRDVTRISLSTTLLGIPSSLPIFIAPAAMARLGHPDGELNLTRGAGRTGIVQGISANASCSLEEIIGTRGEGQPLIFQLYMNWDRDASEKLVRKVESLGCNAIILTVDAAVPGKRERDIRAKGDFDSADSGTQGVAQAISGYQAADVTWADVAWLRGLTKLPLVLKGIQSVEDARLAVEAGVQGIVLSNHGGRQLDFAPASIDVLRELREEAPEVFNHLEVYLDGGVRRGTDVLKALCLGARAVGLGRPFLYAQSAYGEEGVVRAVQIMEEEIGTGLRLLGVTKLEDLRPEMVRHFARDPAPPEDAV